jgi:hypothetical protein
MTKIPLLPGGIGVVDLFGTEADQVKLNMSIFAHADIVAIRFAF